MKTQKQNARKYEDTSEIWNGRYGWKNENWRKWWNGLAPKPTGLKAKPKKEFKKEEK